MSDKLADSHGLAPTNADIEKVVRLLCLATKDVLKKDMMSLYGPPPQIARESNEILVSVDTMRECLDDPPLSSPHKRCV